MQLSGFSWNNTTCVNPTSQTSLALIRMSATF
jgi:hypothetical protein